MLYFLFLYFCIFGFCCWSLSLTFNNSLILAKIWLFIFPFSGLVGLSNLQVGLLQKFGLWSLRVIFAFFLLVLNTMFINQLHSFFVHIINLLIHIFIIGKKYLFSFGKSYQKTFPVTSYFAHLSSLSSPQYFHYNDLEGNYQDLYLNG